MTNFDLIFVWGSWTLKLRNFCHVYWRNQNKVEKNQTYHKTRLEHTNLMAQVDFTNSASIKCKAWKSSVFLAPIWLISIHKKINPSPNRNKEFLKLASISQNDWDMAEFLIWPSTKDTSKNVQPSHRTILYPIHLVQSRYKTGTKTIQSLVLCILPPIWAPNLFQLKGNKKHRGKNWRHGKYFDSFRSLNIQTPIYSWSTIHQSTSVQFIYSNKQY